MSASLAITIAVYAIVIAVLTAIRSALGGAIGRLQVAAMVLLVIAATGQALGAAVGLIGGHEVSEQGVLIGYLAVSVAILPLSFAAAGGDESRWRGATVALGLVALAVVSLRSLSLWQG